MNPPSAIEREVQRLRALVAQRRFAEVLAAATTLSHQVPENRDVLYLQALAHRMLGDTASALVVLAALEQLHPRFSRLYQERGQCYVALKQAGEAIAAFEQAVGTNPSLPVSWSMLAGLYRMTGRAADASLAAERLAEIGRAHV